MKSKYAVLLVCLFLVVAAVDTIPDPPAINPPTSHGCSISSLLLCGPVTLLKTEWYLAPGSLQREDLNRSAFRLVQDTRPAGICSLPFVHHAADVSPPGFF